MDLPIFLFIYLLQQNGSLSHCGSNLRKKKKKNTKNQILEKDRSLDRYMTDILEVQIKSKTMMINRKLEKEADKRT